MRKRISGGCAAISLLLAVSNAFAEQAEPLHVWLDEPPDQSWEIEGQYPSIPGARHARILTTDEAYGGYNHHAKIVRFGGRFYAAWSNSRYDEDGPGQRVLMATSEDGLSWSAPRELIPSLSPESPWGRPGYFMQAGEFFEWNGRLFGVGAVTEIVRWTNREKTVTAAFYDARKHGWPVYESFGFVVREIRADGSLGKVAANEVFSAKAKSEKLIRPVPSVDEVYSGLKRPATPWDLADAFRQIPERRMCEPTVWKSPSGGWTCLFRDDSGSNRKWMCFSQDGKAWTKPAMTDMFDAPSQDCQVTLPDGRILLFGNHRGKGKVDKQKRWRDRDPLMVSVSDDGRTFSRTHTVVEGYHVQRVKGPRARGGSAQYPRAILVGNNVHVVYSNGKEDIETTVFDVRAILGEAPLPSSGLRTSALRELPLGSVRPEGHLERRLRLQADGLTGHAEEIYEDIGQSDWLTNAGRRGQFSWERGPYYARGLVSLAFALDDAALKERARKWVDATLASQRDDGDFGPRRNNWWANMVPLCYLRDWADATGDGRVVPFLERYFGYQMKELETVPLQKESSWACARGGDEIDAVLWLYGKTGEAKWLDFARRLADQTADWTTYYHDGGDPGVAGPGRGGYRCHIVNFMQGLKFPAFKWLLGGTFADRSAYAAAFDPDGWAMRTCGRPDGMLNGSEPLTDRSASGGTELCAIAERIVSAAKTVAALGDVAPADDMEDVAYNALAATFSRDMKGVRYYLMLNQPCCVDKGLLFANNGHDTQITGANCPGPHSGFGCCRSNGHMAWPKFVQFMWMRKGDGLAAVAHGPSRVTADLPCGRVTVREETEYPYSDEVTIRIVEGNGRFPIYVRVPQWAKVADAGTFRKIERDWKSGDAVTVRFPSDVAISSWANDAVAVRRGPLLYALRIGEKAKRVSSYKEPYAARTITDDGTSSFPRWEIEPTSPWNYALVLDGNRALADMEVAQEGGVPVIRAQGVRTSAGGWGCLRADAPGRAVDPPFSPVRREAAAERITLVPIGETQIRITLFPWTR